MVMIPEGASYLPSEKSWNAYVQRLLVRDKISPSSEPRSFPCYVQLVHVVNSNIGGVSLAIVQIWHVDVMKTVLKYGIYFDPRYFDWVSIEATKYSEVDSTPISWAIRRGGTAMSKNDGMFYHEPQPSSRDEDFFSEFRFDTPGDAFACWQKFNNHEG